MDRAEVFCRPLLPGRVAEMVRECVPGDAIRSCDCNHKKDLCHCSDSDCDWESCIIHCNCKVRGV